MHELRVHIIWAGEGVYKIWKFYCSILKKKTLHWAKIFFLESGSENIQIYFRPVRPVT